MGLPIMLYGISDILGPMCLWNAEAGQVPRPVRSWEGPMHRQHLAGP